MLNKQLILYKKKNEKKLSYNFLYGKPLGFCRILFSKPWPIQEVASGVEFTHQAEH